VLKSLAVLAWIWITGDTNNIQDVYADGGRGGLLSLVLGTVFIAVFSPLGVELLYRGITTALLLLQAVSAARVRVKILNKGIQ
jgi:uncharacterized protein